jgi:hypothetical protein
VISAGVALCGADTTDAAMPVVVVLHQAVQLQGTQRFPELYAAHQQ